MYEIFRVEKYITLLLNLILGNRCEQDIDECSTTKPCRNGATCNNTHGSYVCWCPKGYEGRHCENNPDDCVPSRCFMCNGLNNLSVDMYLNTELFLTSRERKCSKRKFGY